MSVFSEAVRDFLAAQGLTDGATGWPLTTGRLGGVEGRAVQVTPTGGPEPELGSDRRWDRPTIQVLVRGAPLDHEPAFDKAEAIRAALDGGAVSGVVDLIPTQSQPFSLGEDERGQPRYVVNYRTWLA